MSGSQVSTEGAGPALRLEVIEGPVALVTFDQPGLRVNTLSLAVLGELEALAADLARRTDLQGLVLRSGKPGVFVAGADLRELGGARPDPEEVRRLTRRGLDAIAAVEGLPFPTVAAIDGACLGGGLELALGFDYRLATPQPQTQLGLPEVTLGLIPGWGGTQRLSRLIGPALAAELICAGEKFGGRRARELGIVFDVVPAERLQEEALALLRWARQSGDWQEARRRKRQPVGLSEEQHAFVFAVARGEVLARTRGQAPAPLAALEAIARGCNLPLEEGLRAETDAFAPLVGSPVSRNLIAVFFMSQRLQKDPGVANPAVRPRQVRRVGVLGAGIMGSGIAGAFLRRGVPVMMLDNNPQALEKGVAAIARVNRARVEAGRMTAEEAATVLTRLGTTTLLDGMADRDVVIEAVVEDEEAKTRLYRELELVLPPGAILASNTSTISISRMAGAVDRPEAFAGMHFFNPVERMQLVEVIRGTQTSDETVATLVALAKGIGKTPIVVRDGPGFLVNRVLFPYLNEALLLLEEGADPRAVDRAAVAFGMPMGPIALHDVVGLDTSLSAGRVIQKAFPDRFTVPRLLEELVAAGRLGRKSGAGFYGYARDTRGGRGADDPALQPLLERCRTASREVGAEEITDRLFLPMLVEATRALAEGIVRLPGDVDMGLILGIGFPTFRGGILRWADTLGLPAVLDRLSRYESLGPRFQPTELLRRAAAEGKSFYPRLPVAPPGAPGDTQAPPD